MTDSPPEPVESNARGADAARSPASRVLMLAVVAAPLVVGLAAVAASLPPALRKVVILPILLGAAGGATVAGLGRVIEARPPRWLVGALLALAFAGYAWRGTSALLEATPPPNADERLAAAMLEQFPEEVSPVPDALRNSINKPAPLSRWLTWRLRAFGPPGVAISTAISLFEAAAGIAAGLMVFSRVSRP